MSTTPDATCAQANANPETRSPLPKVAIATALVSGLEIFDFTVFGLFAPMIGDHFFPAANPLTSLLLAMGTFGVGFLMRPLGAMMIGAYADRVGRRVAMTTTCWLMSLGTAAIGLCPPYAMIGVAAPLIVVVARALQGLAAGGEVGAAASFAMEAAPVSRRGWLVSWQLAGQGAAALLGASLGMLLSTSMSPAHLASWGWRMPFLIGLLIAPAGVYVRRRLQDTRRPGATDTRSRTPLAELRREHGKTVILATLMTVWQTVTFYTVVYFMPSYLTRVMHMPAIIGFRSSALAALLLVVVSPLSGLLADRLPRRKPLVLLTSGATALLVYPVFMMITRAHGMLPILFGVGLISILVALGTGVGTMLVLEALPARVRASGFATAHALGVALFGGTAQFIVTALIKWSGDPLSAAWYVAPICLVSFCALILFKEQRAQH